MCRAVGEGGIMNSTDEIEVPKLGTSTKHKRRRRVRAAGPRGTMTWFLGEEAA